MMNDATSSAWMVVKGFFHSPNMHMPKGFVNILKVLRESPLAALW